MAKGRHRMERQPIVWKYQRAMYLNRWYAFWKPALKKWVKGLFNG
jgi:hypothetical protein